ncbi:MAG: DUF4431 domain-containing protein [Anaerolineae bacterium]
MKRVVLKLICVVLSIIAVLCGVYYFFIKKTNPLQLSIGVSQPLVTLKGKLVLKLFPGPPEYSSIEDGDRADYCWILQLDSLSLHRALITPVAEPANSSVDIMNRSNHGEVLLAIDRDMENFCYEHQDQQVIAEGHLFHAHTAHHYTAILMDVKKIL